METLELKTPRLRALRVSRALGQSELAKQAGISRGTVIHLEGGGDAQPRTVRKLAEALGVAPAELMEAAAR